MSSIISYEYLGVIGICLIGQLWSLRRGDERWRVWGILANGLNALVDFSFFIYYTFRGKPVNALWEGLFGLFAAFIVWWLWRNWKDKKKVKEALGAKSKALRDKLVRKVKQTQQPRPVKVPA